MRTRIAMALLGTSLAACATTTPAPSAVSTEVASRAATAPGAIGAARSAPAQVGITGAGSSADGLEEGGVAPALAAGDASVLDAVHAWNHPPRPESVGRGTGGHPDAWLGRPDVEIGGYESRGHTPRAVRPQHQVLAAAAETATDDDRRLLATRQGRLRRCYVRELATTPGLEGTVAVEVRRDAKGETSSATVTGVRGGPFPTAFEACLRDAVVGATGEATGAPRVFRFTVQVSPG